MKKMPLKFKIYSVVLGVGFIAVIADQFNRPAASDELAAGSPASLLISVADRAQVPTVPGATTKMSDCTIAQTLRSAQQSGQWPAAESPEAHDPFATFTGSGKASAGTGSFTPLGRAAQFTAAHHLTNVISSTGQKHAMIDGSILTVGQSIDGFTIQSIGARTVLLQSGGERVTLELTANRKSPLHAR